MWCKNSNKKVCRSKCIIIMWNWPSNGQNSLNLIDHNSGTNGSL